MIVVLLVTVLIISLGLLGIVSVYSYQTFRKTQFLMDSVENLDLQLQNFADHLKHLYELDMYYGDETLETLIKHSKEIVEKFEVFREDYAIYNGEIDGEIDKEEIESTEKKD